MLKKNKKVEEDITSLNDRLTDEFYVNQLEERLETDPLATGGLFHLFSTQNMVDASADWCIINIKCGEFANNL